jgi:hypothetical protein
MCAGGMKEERCKERGAIGPYPYAVGMLQVLSYRVAAWMVEQPNFLDFEKRATAAIGRQRRPDGTPLIMDHGEDMVIGMFLYLSPWPLMPLHWGWDKLHDLCFTCTRKDQIWRPITTQCARHHGRRRLNCIVPRTLDPLPSRCPAGPSSRITWPTRTLSRRSSTTSRTAAILTRRRAATLASISGYPSR